MPGQDYSPPIAISAEFDARQWNATDVSAGVFNRGGAATVLSDFGAGEGLYDDILSFLNWRGSLTERLLQSDARVEWAASGAANSANLTITLTALDRVEIRHAAAGGPVAFDVAASTLGSYGFASGGQSSGLDGGDQVLVADNEWIRGNVVDQAFAIDPAGAPAAFSVPSVDHRSQDVITMLRFGGFVGDADDSGRSATMESLEFLDNAINDVAGGTRYRWGVTDQQKLVTTSTYSGGYVWWAAPTALNAGVGITWVDTDFRDRLGFSGDEIVVQSGGLDFVIADFQLPGFLLPIRPMDGQRRWYDEDTSTVRRQDGILHSSTVQTFNGWDVSFFVGGDPDENDDSRQFLEHVLPFMQKGRRVTVYQDWGDPRRAREDRVDKTRTGGASVATSYTVLNTHEFNGYRGRLRTRRSGDSPSRFDAAWEGPIRQRFLVQLALEDSDD